MLRRKQAAVGEEKEHENRDQEANQKFRPVAFWRFFFGFHCDFDHWRCFHLNGGRGFLEGGGFIFAKVGGFALFDHGFPSGGACIMLVPSSGFGVFLSIHADRRRGLRWTLVALAGIEPAPLLAQRAPYTKGGPPSTIPQPETLATGAPVCEHRLSRRTSVVREGGIDGAWSPRPCSRSRPSTRRSSPSVLCPSVANHRSRPSRPS